MRYILSLLALGIWLVTSTAQAAHTQVQLLLSANPARPGDIVWAGVDLKMDSGWHTYWKNPGDSGIATQIKWQLPPGVTAGDVQWPLPHKLPPIDVTTYGYEDEVMLLVPLTLASNLNPGTLTLSADVTWLECQDQCVPGSATVQAKLTVGNETTPSADAAMIESWKNKTPKPANDYSLQAWWEKVASDGTRPVVITAEQKIITKASLYDSVDFFPEANDNYDVQSATEVIAKSSADLSLRKTVKKYSGDWPKEISGVFVMQAGTNRHGIKVTVPVAEHATAQAAISSMGMAANSTSTPLIGNAASSSATPTNLIDQPIKSIWLALGSAFLGGLIMNIMPCVLPVIALKILGFVNEANSDPRRVRFLGSIFALGVMVSFLTLAALIIGLKAAGHNVLWGVQFGNPIFLAGLAIVITLVSLNLFGVFEVTLSGRAMDTAGELASRHGASGAFFNGVLTTTLATSCTAPVLASALGFAFVQPAGIIVLIFCFVGLGLVAPYILLSWNPALLKFLPKPGGWMEKFKIAMGFPMLATVIWLLYIASATYGRDVAWLGGFLVVVALAAWIFGEFVQRGRGHKAIAAIIALLLLGGGYLQIMERELHWRTFTTETAASNASPEKNRTVDNIAEVINWQPWSPEAIAKAQAAGQPVLVDFTADWCINCQYNKKTSIEIPSVIKRLKELNAVTLVADYTRTPDNITRELQRFGRAGVPLVLVYPKEPNGNPAALPALLTPGIVLAALDKAAQ